MSCSNLRKPFTLYFIYGSNKKNKTVLERMAICIVKTFQKIFRPTLNCYWLCTFYKQAAILVYFYCFAECMAGYIGRNCTSKCPFPYYGVECQQKCNCNHSLCNISTGCIAAAMPSGVGTCKYCDISRCVLTVYVFLCLHQGCIFAPEWSFKKKNKTEIGLWRQN